MKRQVAAEFSMEELQEFLEGDLYPDRADPNFKEELRDELWRTLESRRLEKPSRDD
ncbi:MAG: hypothetical protein GY723_15640 [bacterium]|nr:hypothetical protein [bacterium]